MGHNHEREILNRGIGENTMNKDELLAKQQAEVDSKLWAMANDLRGNMEASEFKNYILGLIF